MGQEEESAARLKAFPAYQINAELMKFAKNDAIILHCLPAHRGEEISAEMLESPRSRVFQQAENRLHAQKAVLSHLLGQDTSLSSVRTPFTSDP
jgi:ornithine carbamoyltransferase